VVIRGVMGQCDRRWAECVAFGHEPQLDGNRARTQARLAAITDLSEAWQTRLLVPVFLWTALSYFWWVEKRQRIALARVALGSGWVWIFRGGSPERELEVLASGQCLSDDGGLPPPKSAANGELAEVFARQWGPRARASRPWCARRTL